MAHARRAGVGPLPVLCLLTILLAPAGLAAQEAPSPSLERAGDEETVATFSIVAHDPGTGELGVAVQSRAFRAGAIVPYAKAGVGAVATQAAANRAYGPEGLRLLEMGASPDEAVRRLTEADPGRDRRQLAIIDASGRVRAFTGSETSDWAGHIEGENYSVQGNILAGEAVVEEMARAYEETEGALAERLMASLDAGQAAGGDARGKQAGGILVVRPIGDSSRDTDKWVDIRVDDSRTPFEELRRLLDLAMARNHSRDARRLADEGRFPQAIAAQEKALAVQPDRDRYRFGLARLHARAGDAAAAVEVLSGMIESDAQWRERAASHPDFEAIRDDPRFRGLVEP